MCATTLSPIEVVEFLTNVQNEGLLVERAFEYLRAAGLEHVEGNNNEPEFQTAVYAFPDRQHFVVELWWMRSGQSLRDFQVRQVITPGKGKGEKGLWL